ncbi:MAG: protein-L-isoaspartate O-methyltransferase [Desulfurococcaceae archaeon TW002]
MIEFVGSDEVFRVKREKLVKSLIEEGILKSEEVIKAMLSVPREEFVPLRYRELAYLDTPLSIGYGQTISAPHMVAIMTEALKVSRGNKVLEVGTGSGYQAAIIAEIVKPEGHVWTIEIVPELAKFAEENLRRTGYSDYVSVIIGDGSKGYEEAAPYDRIIVTAAAPEVPKPLISQLKEGGRIVIPVGDMYVQILKIIEKKRGTLHVEDSVPCVFVPLIGEYGFKKDFWHNR